MANRYWILGTGSWSSSNTANWSSSLPLSFTASRSGTTTLTTVGSPALVPGMTLYDATGVSRGTILSGSVNTWITNSGTTITPQTCVAANPGASVPTAADNVFFNATSNVGTGSFAVTILNTPRVCNDLTVSGLDGAMSVIGTISVALNVSGSLLFPASNLNIASWGGPITFNATTTGKTVTTNGVTINNSITFSGTGGGWTLGSALTCTILTVQNGTFSTSSSGNYAVTAAYLYSSYSTLRTINLNASTVTLSDNTGVYILITSALTFNAGTSTINLSNASAEIASGGLTFYNVAFTSTAPTFLDISGVNTFNNLTYAGRTTVGRSALSFDANQTINGTFTVSAGTTAAYRTQISSTFVGTTRTLTCAAVSFTDVDFRDITIAGAASPATGTRLGNGKGNSGITFPAAKTVYYRQTGSADWGATGSGSWSATSGGALDATMFPLAQDTAVFPAATYPASGFTTTINAGYYIGTIDMSLRTSNTMTLANGTFNVLVIGNWINGTGITLSGSGTISFIGRATQTITSAGRSFTQGLSFSNPSGSVTLQDALTQGAGNSTTLNQGTLDLNGFTCTIGTRFTTGTGTKNLTFNGGTLVCPDPNTTAFNNAAPTGFTTTAGTGVGTISMTAATAKTFVGGGSTFNCTLNQGGAGALTITGSNTFNNITNTVQPASVLFTAGTTSTFTSFSLSGTAGNLITIGSDTAASHTLSKASGTVSVSFCSISNSTATGGATWEALTANGNVNGGNNTGWIFNYILAFIYETATATDSVLSFADFYAALSETATATDSVLSLADFYAVLAETATATDAVLSFVDFYAALAETATATDAVLSLADFYAALAETVTATDSPSVAASTFNAPVAETATATDSVLSFADFYAALSETATATDSPLVAPSTFNAPVAETATATDSPLVAPSTFNAPVSETVTISDLVLGAYLWNLIDDSQSVTWQNVNSSPGTTWSPIDTDPNTGWTDIPTVN